jgi:ABC-type phosphate/phosphonate transport system permease subunit
VSILAVFVMGLVGAGQLGVAKIDFMQDVVKNWQNNELVALFIAGMVGVVASLLVKVINTEKYGYLR